MTAIEYFPLMFTNENIFGGVYEFVTIQPRNSSENTDPFWRHNENDHIYIRLGFLLNPERLHAEYSSDQVFDSFNISRITIGETDGTTFGQIELEGQNPTLRFSLTSQSDKITSEQLYKLATECGVALSGVLEDRGTQGGAHGGASGGAGESKGLWLRF